MKRLQRKNDKYTVGGVDAKMFQILLPKLDKPKKVKAAKKKLKFISFHYSEEAYYQQ
jgi:hypothetical protein